MEEKEIEKEVLILKGKGYLLARMPREAYDTYQKAGIKIPRKDFDICATDCFKEQMFLEAAQAYSIAENADGLIKAGNELLAREQDSSDAEKAYREAVALLHRNQKSMGLAEPE